MYEQDWDFTGVDKNKNDIMHNRTILAKLQALNMQVLKRQSINAKHNAIKQIGLHACSVLDILILLRSDSTIICAFILKDIHT